MYESSGGLKQSGIAGHCPLNPSLRSQAEGWRETCFLPCCLFKNFLKLHLFIMSVCTHMWRLEDSLRDLVLSCAVWPRDQDSGCQVSVAGISTCWCLPGSHSVLLWM